MNITSKVSDVDLMYRCSCGFKTYFARELREHEAETEGAMGHYIAIIDLDGDEHA
jgi:hypothetical protein